MAAKDSFESAIAKLEEIVEKLETPELSLDKGLQLFEEGVKQARLCEQKLKEAEGKLEKLVQKNGRLQKEKLDS